MMMVPANETGTGLTTRAARCDRPGVSGAEGWVIVDYKTDRAEPRLISKLVEHYRPQVGSLRRYVADARRGAGSRGWSLFYPRKSLWRRQGNLTMDLPQERKISEPSRLRSSRSACSTALTPPAGTAQRVRIP